MVASPITLDTSFNTVYLALKDTQLFAQVLAIFGSKFIYFYSIFFLFLYDDLCTMIDGIFMRFSDIVSMRFLLVVRSTAKLNISGILSQSVFYVWSLLGALIR